MIQESLDERQDFVNVFKNDPMSKYLIWSKIFFNIIRFMVIRINLIRIWQINIIDPEYNLYAME